MTSNTFSSLPLTHASAAGVAVPQLGFGVWEVPEEDVESVVGKALEVGYRHIDTARAYDNEAGVGRALAASDVPREEIFVTTKLWNDDHRDAASAFDASMKRLGIETLDLYLIHWPAPKQDGYVEAWSAMLEL